ncbi:tyrosine-type recombinase/integrase [Botrimarina sp.]|uniref:tyrosine-type recombinase/integrase n=1 Tax=Botrimarina sp. TaxID=2795802 RepID=UPI0032EFEF71
MRAWVFQDAKQLAKRGAKHCPWSVGWYDARGKKKQKTIGAKTTAKAYARKLEGEAAAGLLKSHDRMRWADFVERFTRDHLATLAPRSREEYSASFESFNELVKPRYIDEVDEAAVAEYRSKRFAEVSSPATVNKDLRHLRCALNRARKWKLIADRIDVDMLREPERDPAFVDDATFKLLYDACSHMTQPAGRHYPPEDWWKALLTFAYLTGWRISEILALRRDGIDWANGVAHIPAEETKGKRDARIDLHPAVIDHLKGIVGFDPLVFDWPMHKRALWDHFSDLKKAAGVTLPGAFHRFRFGFANANVDTLPADVLQRLMRHRAAATTRHYVNMAERMRRQKAADLIHVPAFLKKEA